MLHRMSSESACVATFTFYPSCELCLAFNIATTFAKSAFIDSRLTIRIPLAARANGLPHRSISLSVSSDSRPLRPHSQTIAALGHLTCSDIVLQCHRFPIGWYTRCQLWQGALGRGTSLFPSPAGACSLCIWSICNRGLFCELTSKSLQVY